MVIRVVIQVDVTRAVGCRDDFFSMAEERVVDRVLTQSYCQCAEG